MRLSIVADKFAATLQPVRKQLPPIWTGRQRGEGQRTGGQLKGYGRTPAKKSCRLAQGPNVASGKAAYEKIVTAIRRPYTAAFDGRTVPSRKQGMKIASIGTHLPKRGRVAFGPCNGEADARAIRGKVQSVGLAWNGGQLVRTGAIGVGLIDV